MRKNVSYDKCLEYAETLKKMIDCKTVFDNKNKDEYIKFNQVIEESFPLINEKCEKLVFGSGCFLYLLKGKNATKNIMLMSHHDVVKETSNWESDAFTAVIKDKALYGRGSIDTKTPLFAELQAIEELLSEGYEFNGINVYIGSSNNEEVCGDGMVLVNEYFKENNIHIDTILDEGGAILSNMIPGYNGKSAMVAVHELSRHMYKCSVNLKTVGHGGLTPSNDSPILRLLAFINEVNNTKIYKPIFYPEVKETFKSHVPSMKNPIKFVFKHFNLFSPIIKKIMNNIPQAKAMLKTQVSFTTFFAGDENNPQIKAKEAYCNMFIRCIREEDLNKGLEQIKEIAKKYDVNIELVERDYCKPSTFNSEAFKKVKKVLNNNFPDVVVAPFLLTAGTDARRFSETCDNILRFAPIDLNKEQFNSIHGDNEHIYIENIGECVCFYKDIIKEF